MADYSGVSLAGQLATSWGRDLGPLKLTKQPRPEDDRDARDLEPTAPNRAISDHDALELSGRRALLRRGSAGAAVADLQARLNAAGFPCGTPDSEFGARTRAAVIRFQQAHQLPADGIVGPDTWSALTGAVAPAPPPSAPRHQNVVRTADGPMVRRGDEMIAARIAPQYDQMVDHARRDGVSLRLEDGYRSVAEQRVLWNRYHHRRGRVAPPGQSNHQTGTAMDFKETRGAWRWLRHHAHEYGFQNYKPEPWHYSLNGR